jgi:hypothetical protein
MDPLVDNETSHAFELGAIAVVHRAGEKLSTQSWSQGLGLGYVGK